MMKSRHGVELVGVNDDDEYSDIFEVQTCKCKPIEEHWLALADLPKILQMKQILNINTSFILKQETASLHTTTISYTLNLH